jgi:pimeloyl-ACP methyl ester carboxylesterase
MGGWISFLMARRIPEKMAGVVTIAAAPDFTEDGMWADWSEDQRETLMEEGQLALPSDYGEDMIVTRRMIEDGREQLVLRTPLEIARAGADAAGHGGCGCAHGGGDAPP